MPFGRKSPLEALALPGVILAYKYSQFRQRRREAASRRVTERELTALHHKIDKLLNKLEESEPEPPTSQEDECVICINARATMQTSPCGHRVVCRRCFVKTIQSAVAQRLLPLRCVICRARVNRLTSGTGSWRIQESASSYSMGSKSWSVPGSASSYSVDVRVAQSTSLYSMSSGSSSMSGVSNCSAETSSNASTSAMSSTSIASGDHHHRTAQTPHHHHPHGYHASCSNGCLGAIPRNPSTSSSSSASTSSSNAPTNVGPHVYLPHSYHHHHRRGSSFHHKGRVQELQQNRLPPIKEFRSPAKIPHPSPVHASNPKFRYASYTAQKSHETVPLLDDDCPPPRIKTSSMNAAASSSIISGKSSNKLGGLNAKVAPMRANSPMSKANMAAGNKSEHALAARAASPRSFSVQSAVGKCGSSGGGGGGGTDEKADNRKNESMEKKKKEEKHKMKAEKEARKEEKRLAKEEERLAKMLAKEEKKKSKKEAKELLLGSDAKN